MRVANLSVAISTLDRPDALARCLSALWSGDIRPAEIVVVDQSQDDTTRSLVETCQGRGMPIEYFRQRARGLAVSQNAAMARARFPVVAVIDDDCVPERTWLEVVEKSFAECDTLAALTGRVIPLQGEGDKIYPISSRLSTVRAGFTRKHSPWIVGSGNNFAIKREWFIKVGGCDERLGPGSAGQGGVDMDLFYRLLRAAAHLRYEPEMVVRHERKTKEGRMRRRTMYGRGMGACCAIWLRQGDIYALRVLAHWVVSRIRLLGSGAWHRRWMSVYEECLVLTGTVSGLIYGARANDSARANLPCNLAAS
jgi:glycosyltransferase involved in cell wall biosynthesis